MLNKLSTLRAQGVSEEGFTLIELIIVVVIIGILSAIAIPIFMNQQKSAVAAGVKSDVRNTNTNIATALAKDPTAGTIAGDSSATPAAPITVGSETADFVVSDDATTIVVATTTAGLGWQGYTVTGTNTGLGAAADNYYEFDSGTGEYTGLGDLA